VNSLSHLYVAAHLAEMHKQAANERLAPKRSTTSPVRRLEAAIRSVWSLPSGPAERPLTPTLTNYPFRG
jgi:hypothetical protein